MRLTCPNCDAQYEVPADVIPTAGRDVQCSNCGKSWYQYHPDHLPEEDQTNGDAQVEETPPAPKRRELDPEVASILREEAETEQAARNAVRRATTIDNPPEDTADQEVIIRTAPKEAPPPAPKRPEPPEPPAEPTGTDAAIAATVAAAGAAVSARQDKLPDAEDIGSSLRATDDSTPEVEDLSGIASAPRSNGRRGFRLGFWIIVLLFVIGLLVYMFAPQIAEQFPQFRAQLEQYVMTVDKGRIWFDGQIAALMQWLDSMTSGTTAPTETAPPPADSSAGPTTDSN